MSVDLFPCVDSLLPWLPGETLFSLCSRQHRLWGYSLSSRSTEIMFGGKRLGTQHDFPSGLDSFALRTEGQLGSAVEIARDRTMLRFYRLILGTAEIDHAVWAMRGLAVAHLKFRLGLLTSRFRANHPLKACVVRISAIVDARFSLIVDGETASSRVRRGGAQARGLNVAQPSTISLKRSPARGVSVLVLGLD